MARPMRRLLVAIRDVHHVPRSVLRKTGEIARRSGARVELFHALTESPAILAAWRGYLSDDLQRSEDEYAQAARLELERLQRTAFLRDLPVSAEAVWDYPPHEAIVRRSRAIRADLVIAFTPARSAKDRLYLANTDWELIRHCPQPVLLVKSSRAYDRPVVLAAVDPFHARAKPSHLDSRILDAAAGLARLLRGELHAFHASAAPEQEAARIREPFDRLCASARISPSRRHLAFGDVATRLDETVRRLGAGIVVMGAVSRSGPDRPFIGGTAELVLDRLSCDALVVKPRGFRPPPHTFEERPIRPPRRLAVFPGGGGSHS